MQSVLWEPKQPATAIGSSVAILMSILASHSAFGFSGYLTLCESTWCEYTTPSWLGPPAKPVAEELTFTPQRL